jgi:DNA topoisomerase VI subunit B
MTFYITFKDYKLQRLRAEPAAQGRASPTTDVGKRSISPEMSVKKNVRAAAASAALKLSRRARNLAKAKKMTKTKKWVSATTTTTTTTNNNNNNNNTKALETEMKRIRYGGAVVS